MCDILNISVWHTYEAFSQNSFPKGVKLKAKFYENSLLLCGLEVHNIYELKFGQMCLSIIGKQ